MRTINLSGFKQGDSLNISVSQGAITAGPYSIGSWGGGGDGGTISIVMHRSEMLCAPESVRLTVDLSLSTFDTAGPTGGEVYDARLHDLIYLWDMDDTVTTWNEPVNVMTAWKNRNVAKGPFVMHMYPEPGTYSPSVLVIEPSSGKTATASLSGDDAITVLDPDDVYPGTATICVNRVGDSDFTGKPTGAAEVNADYFDFRDSYWSSRLGGVAKRWLFKRGSDFDWRVEIGATTTRGVYFGAYGTGANPKISQGDYQDPGDHINSMCPLFIGAYRQQGDMSGNADIRIVGLDPTGTYDPVTTRSDYRVSEGKTAAWAIANDMANIIMYDCHLSGLQGSSLYLSMASTPSIEAAIHLDSCTMTAFGGQYPLFGGRTTHERSGMAVTGCRFAQTPGAISGDVSREGSSRAIIRSNSPHRFHARGCDFYHTDCWQHCLKTPETPQEYGVLVNIHSCSFEGGAGALVFNGNHEQSTFPGETGVHNIIIDGITHLSNHSSNLPMQCTTTGVTIRNSLFVIPAVSRAQERPQGFIRLLADGDFDADIVGAAPIRVYNNTFRNDKTSLQNMGQVTIALIPVFNYGQVESSAMTNYTEQNNIMHQPNIDIPLTAFAPVSGDALWPARDIGYRHIDPGFGRISNATITVANGASITYNYDPAYGFMPITQANFAGSNGKEAVIVGSTIYYAVDGDFTVDYGATEITVTNTSGATWSITGGLFWVQFDMGSTAPIATDTVPPAGSWKDTKPLPGSAALGAALTGDVSYMDILGTTRTAPADKGAWDVA